jgi:cell division septum initiation protein DivIVA
MSEHSEFSAEAGIVEWEREVRGYNRQQVDEVVARQTGAIRDLKNSLSQCLGEIERLRGELTEVREAGGRPQHEQISERVGQILKLADDEAKVIRENAGAEIADLRDAAKDDTDKLRADTKHETDALRAEAQDRAERMLSAAAEQSERTVAAAKTEAEETVASASAAAEQSVSDANKHAESTIAAAMAQAKQQIDEATARATAIHDGAERRLNLLISRHTETVRRLTEIRDVVTSLVSGEAARGSLEEEVNRALHAQVAGAGNGEARPAGPHDHGQGGAHRARPDQHQPQPGHSPRAGGPAPGSRRDHGEADPLTSEHNGAELHGSELYGSELQDPELPSPGLPSSEGPSSEGPSSELPSPELNGPELHGPEQGSAEPQGQRRNGSQPVDTTKRMDRVLDEAGAGSGSSRGIDG